MRVPWLRYSSSKAESSPRRQPSTRSGSAAETTSSPSGKLASSEKSRSSKVEKEKPKPPSAHFCSKILSRSSGVTSEVTRFASGKGKARRYPRETAKALLELRAGGASIKTTNLYLSGMKAFCNWMVRDGRLAANPLDHLTGLDPQNDRRHDRRLLDEGELGRVIAAASTSTLVFRRLAGVDLFGKPAN